MFPATRSRRLRQNKTIRSMVHETHLSRSNFIVPLFVTHGSGVRKPIPSMPGQFQLSCDELRRECKKIEQLKLPAVLLFGIPKRKDAIGKEAFAADGIIQKAIRDIKKHFPKLIVMADLCFCEYTSHGHCGVIKKKGPAWDVDNDATLNLIRKTAKTQAKAGVDFVAPSGMIDGAVGAIRKELDASGFKNVGIMAYSAKFASAFYGPFRDAAESTPQFGNRKTYQMDPGNIKEALREIRADIQEGADMVMVKPALAYLDILARIRPELDVPLVAYNVSGEYSMVQAALQKGWMDRKKPSPVVMEILTAMRRAGADLIISYHAIDMASYLP